MMKDLVLVKERQMLKYREKKKAEVFGIGQCQKKMLNSSNIPMTGVFHHASNGS